MFRLFVLIISLAAIGVGGFFWTQMEWDGESRLNVLYLSDQKRIESFDPQINEKLVIPLPDNLLIQSVRGRGVWQLRGVTGAGDIEWQVDSIESTLGISIDVVGERFGLVDGFRYKYLSRKANTKVLDLIRLKVLETKTLPDEANVYIVGDRAFEIFKKNLLDTKMLGEGISVEIVNTTKTSGMGTHAARFLETRGIRVAAIEVGNEEIDGCEVRGDSSLLKMRTGVFLVKWFGCTKYVDLQQKDELLLKIGREYREWWIGT